MTTPAEQYRTLVARLESIQESPVSAVANAAQPVANAVTSPDASGAVLRALLTTGMSVVPEIVAFLMKNKSQLSPRCQGVLNQVAPETQATGPSPQPGARAPNTTGTAPAPQPPTPQPTWNGPVSGGSV